MLTIFWIILAAIIIGAIIYFSTKKKEKGKADYRNPKEPGENKNVE